MNNMKIQQIIAGVGVIGIIDKGGKKTEVAVDADGKIISTEAVKAGGD